MKNLKQKLIKTIEMTFSQNQAASETPSQEDFIKKQIAERKKTAQHDREKAKTWAKYHKELKSAPTKVAKKNESLSSKQKDQQNKHVKTRRQRKQRS